MKILHIISNLETGGAETQLKQLVKYDVQNTHLIICLMSNDYKKIFNLNNTKVLIFNLNFKKISFNISQIIKLYKLIKQLKPEVIQTWMYKSDLIGGILGKIAGIKVYWNIRNTIIAERSVINKIFFLLNILCSYFIPNKIISCSEKAINEHVKLGYKKNFELIFNSFDHNKFYEDMKIKVNLKKKLNINDNIFVIGRMCRWSPQKDFLTLFKSLNLLKQKCKNKFILILAGKNLNIQNLKLIKMIHQNNLYENVIFLGEIENTNEFYNLIDVNLSTSKYGEGFPNVLAESMLTNTYCVSTNVGDSKFILDKFGYIFDIGDYQALTNQLIKLASKKKFRPLNDSMRKHIIDNFSVNIMLKKYNNIWRNY